MKFVKLILPLALVVSSTYAAAAYKLSVLEKNDKGRYTFNKKGCYCSKSKCIEVGRSKGIYSCVMNYECGIC